MNFNYVGFRPVISQYGISYKQGKDDKYIYLPYVYEVLNAVDSDYEVQRNHSYSIKIDNSNANRLYKKILELDPKLEDDINFKLENYKKNLEIKSLEIENRRNISKIEKDTYINNLNYKKTYRINRAKNKIFYYSAILSIANLIKHKKIKSVGFLNKRHYSHKTEEIEKILNEKKTDLKIINEFKDDFFTFRYDF